MPTGVYKRTKWHYQQIKNGWKNKTDWKPWNYNLHNELTKQKLGSKIKGRTAWNKGIPMSQVAKNKLSNSKKGQIPWMKGKKHKPENMEKFRLAGVKSVKSYNKETKLELVMYEGLKGRIQFKKQIALLGVTVCDIFIEPNHAVYLDGCYYHGCEICLTPKRQTHSIPTKTKKRDKRINMILTDNGYNVIRIPEHEVKSDLEKTINTLISEVT